MNDLDELPIKSIIGDFTTRSINTDLSIDRLNEIHGLIDLELVTLRNGVSSVGNLMGLVGETDNYLGPELTGHIGGLLAMLGRQIDALHVLNAAVDATLGYGGDQWAQ